MKIEIEKSPFAKTEYFAGNYKARNKELFPFTVKKQWDENHGHSVSFEHWTNGSPGKSIKIQDMILEQFEKQQNEQTTNL